MKLRDSGGLPCPDCGSPLKPCKCERGDERRSRYGSTLKYRPGKKLRGRTLEERFKDQQLRYGLLFREIRLLLCFGVEYLPGHICGPGYAPPTAHHLGKLDLDGLLPVCGLLHDEVGEKALEVEKRLRTAGKPSLEAIGKGYVQRALALLQAEGRLPDEVAGPALKRGYLFAGREEEDLL